MASGLLDLTLVPAPRELRARALASVLVDAALGGPAMFHWLADAANGPLVHWERGGDHGFARLEGDEGVVWGFANESPITPWAHDGRIWPAVIDPVPDRWRHVLEAEPDELYRDAVTFCFWFEDGGWRRGPVESPIEGEPDPEGATDLLAWALDAEPSLRDHLAAYHERAAGGEALSGLLACTRGERPLDPAVVAALAPDADVATALDTAAAMGLRAG